MEYKLVASGINTYPLIPGNDLRGCINDLNNAISYHQQAGYSITAFSDLSATYPAKTSAEYGMIRYSRYGDHLVIFNSSHGSNMPDSSGDETTDHRDELTCTADFPNGYMWDDNYRAMISWLPAGVTLDVIMDTCYSGTITKLLEMPNGKPRHRIDVLGYRYLAYPKDIPNTTKPVKYIKPKAPGKAVIVPGMKECLWAACGPGQTSAEVMIGGKPQGAFTYYFYDGLRRFPNYTRDQLMNWIKGKIAELGLTQTPQLECTAANAAKRPFT